MVIAEPSVVALQTIQGVNSVLAVGDDAKLMMGKTPANIQAIRPLRDGVIADIDVAEQMIKHFVEKAQDGNRTVTTVRALNGQKRENEIARMLGGLTVTKKVRETAAELIADADPGAIRWRSFSDRRDYGSRHGSILPPLPRSKWHFGRHRTCR